MAIYLPTTMSSRRGKQPLMKRGLLSLISLLLAFSLVAQIDSASPQPVLPLQVASIEAKAVNNNIRLQWTVNSNEDARSYEVERTTNGVAFQKIGGKLSNGQMGTKSYEFVDAFLKRNSGFSYRIKIIAKDGDISYSILQPVMDEALQIALKQNPVRAQLDLQLNTTEDGLLQAGIYTAYGQQLKTESVRLSTGANSISLNTQTLKAGLYRLVLESAGKRQVLSFVKE